MFDWKKNHTVGKKYTMTANIETNISKWRHHGSQKLEMSPVSTVLSVTSSHLKTPILSWLVPSLFPGFMSLWPLQGGVPRPPEAKIALHPQQVYSLLLSCFTFFRAPPAGVIPALFSCLCWLASPITVQTPWEQDLIYFAISSALVHCKPSENVYWVNEQLFSFSGKREGACFSEIPST